MLRFSDGIEIDPSGEPRVLKLDDGYYAVGKGILIPVDNRQSAEFMVQRMKTWQPGKNIINTRVDSLDLQNK
jgi:hypothetical protein